MKYYQPVSVFETELYIMAVNSGVGRFGAKGAASEH
jgi:hypothetical protein